MVGTRDVMAASFPDSELTDLGAAVLMPGLVNLHSHLEYTALGPLSRPRLFLEWLLELGRRARAWTDEQRLESARQGARMMLTAGVTTLGEIVTRGESLTAMRECGLGGIAYLELLGTRRGDVGPHLRTLRDWLYRARSEAGDRVNIGISPHAVYTNSGAALAGAAHLAAEEDLPLCIHLAETRAEVDLTTDGTGPLADWLLSIGGHELIDVGGAFVGPVALAHRYGLLSRRTVAAHCTHADVSEIRLLRDYDGSVALCPCSNACLGAGQPPVAELLSAAVRTGLGTDSLASNQRLDLFEELRLAREIHDLQVRAGAPRWARASDPAEWLRLITLGGAEAMGLQAEIGTLAPGKWADMIALAPVSEIADPHSWLLEHASAEHVTHTWTSGKLRYTRYESPV